MRGTMFPNSCYGTDIVAPLIYELGKHQAVEFHFLNGLHEVPRFPGLESHYHGPFFRYYGRDAADVTQVAYSMQSLPTLGSSPEDFSRNLRQLCPGDVNSELATQRVLEFARNSNLGSVRWAAWLFRGRIRCRQRPHGSRTKPVTQAFQMRYPHLRCPSIPTR